jgi:cytochrome c553
MKITHQKLSLLAFALGSFGLAAVFVMAAVPAAAAVAPAVVARPAAASASPPLPAQEFADVLGMKPDLVAGAALFETCSGCHGTQGGGLVDGTVPRLAGQHYRVLVKQLVDFRNARRWDYRMEHFADRHHLPEAQDVANVAAYASQLQLTTRSAIGRGDQLARGARIYLRQCQSCHGALGQGSDGKLAPRLAGQQYAYLVRQLHDAADERRPTLSATHGRLARALDKAQLDGLADYLSRSLDPPVPKQPSP